jgi:trigger factor
MEKITDIGQIVSLCETMTHLKLNISCGADRLFAQRWYDEQYATGKHTRYVMKPGLFINSIEDGRVYRAFNTSDEKAIELMEASDDYKDYFIDLQAEAVTIPEVDGVEVVEPEAEPEAEPEVAAPAAVEELTEEEIAAAKRSEAAKKAAATRAANKAAAEAKAAEGLKEFEE